MIRKTELIDLLRERVREAIYNTLIENSLPFSKAAMISTMSPKILDDAVYELVKIAHEWDNLLDEILSDAF